MSELQYIYKQMKQLEKENFKLNFADYKITLPAAIFLFIYSTAAKSIPMSILSLGGVACGIFQMQLGKNLEEKKQKNSDAYYEKARHMHFYTKQAIRLAFNELKKEEVPKNRQEIMRAIRWMKKNDVLRNADKKALFGLGGRKRKGLAKGLKHLRRYSYHLSREEYIQQRENILSYY